MRVCLVDHAYHQRTRSTSFVKQDLLAQHDVDEWWDDRWHSGVAPDANEIVERDYDLIVVLQASELVAELVRAGASNLVFIPMWDNARRLPDKYWRGLGDVRILSFCHALHERMQRLGVLSTYAQYYPDPGNADPVGDFGTLRGFFWQRHFELTWEDVGLLIRGATFSGMHIHLAQDPNAETRSLPSNADIARHKVTTSYWFGTQEEYLDVLARSNVFFAPRLSEGIGFSFLEAMAMGMCVVAVDQPTMSEYITDGVSGLVWPLGKPRPLDFARAAELGRRAHEDVLVGRERWMSELPRLHEFLDTPSDRITPAVRDHTHLREGSHQSGFRSRSVLKQDDAFAPLVSVVTVTLNCHVEFEDTLASVLGQDYPGLEVIVVDGGSTDGTLELIRDNDQNLDIWLSEPDDGPFDAMHKAAGLASGEYLLFMNAGDRFVGPQAINHAFRFAPTDADFIYGHHIYRGLDGVDRLHKANDFEITWQRLLEGDLDGAWLVGVPGHQATFVRTALLREHGFDRSYSVAADHEFMYRMREQGAFFYNCDVVISAYASGGFSWRNQDLCFDEWESMAARYGNPEAARRFVSRLRQTRMRAVGSAVVRRFRLAKHITDSVSAKIAKWRLQRSGLFAAEWYLDRNPDVRDANLDPVAHYIQHGARELRDPSPLFNTALYLSKHPDVARTGASPLLHYLRHGGGKRTVSGSFTSQYGEDEFLVLRRSVPRKGVFVDVGAGDPIRFSNTYSLEQLGWTGLCIDADPEQIEALRRLRTCAVEWAAVASMTGEVELLHCQDPDYSTTLEHLPELAERRGWDYTATRVPAERLETALEKHGIGKIDLLSVDTEGSELDVCETLDWDEHRPRVVVIEYLTHGRPSQEEAIREYFARLPYRLIHRTTSNLIFSETKLPRVLGRWSVVRRYIARHDAKQFPLNARECLPPEGPDTRQPHP